LQAWATYGCDGSNRQLPVNWSSNNTSVATVNNSGTVTAAADGFATIRAMWGPIRVFTGQVCALFNPSCPEGLPVAQASIKVQKPTYVRIIGTPSYTQGPPAPYVYNVNRQILDQESQPINKVMFVDESYGPDPPSGDCTSVAVDANDTDSTAGGTFGPDRYFLPGNAPNPCSSTSTQSFKVTLNGVVHDIQTKYTVRWEYSGVTVTCSAGCQ
jgi:hypothetical protein